MSLDLSRIQALCFDVDGTLSDTDDQFVNRIAAYLRPIRFLLPGRDVMRMARRFVMWAEAPGNLLMGIPDWLGFDGPLAALLEWLNRRRPRPMKHFLLVPGVKETLQTIKGRYPMAVVSAREISAPIRFAPPITIAVRGPSNSLAMSKATSAALGASPAPGWVCTPVRQWS